MTQAQRALRELKKAGKQQSYFVYSCNPHFEDGSSLVWMYSKGWQVGVTAIEPLSSPDTP